MWPTRRCQRPAGRKPPAHRQLLPLPGATALNCQGRACQARPLQHARRFPPPSVPACCRSRRAPRAASLQRRPWATPGAPGRGTRQSAPPAPSRAAPPRPPRSPPRGLPSRLWAVPSTPVSAKALGGLWGPDVNMGIHVVTECSGLEPLPYALDKLGLQGQYVIEAACEIDPKCRRVIKACHTGKAAPRRLYRDIGKRLPEELPDHDLYVAGFASPCLPLHRAGLGRRLERIGGSMAIDDIVGTLEVKLPRAFILENVKALVTHHPRTLGLILKKLRAIANRAYRVACRVLNAADFGLPQHRPRTYIVGCLRTACKGQPPFKWPAPRPMAPLAELLDWVPKSSQERQWCRQRDARFVGRAPRGVAAKVRGAMRKVRGRGFDPYNTELPLVIDIEHGPKAHWMAGRSPCLARSRPRGFYLPALGRMTTIKERLRLQGLPTEIEEKCADEVTQRQLGAMIGDAMTVDVLAALLGNLLPACGLLPLPPPCNNAPSRRPVMA